jgi:NAD(P)-dependent dehydrogenase (short-subunit alcohol dehydrogenase family)
VLAGKNRAEKHRRGTVVVTGAANGIGRATARRLAATGWTVVGVDRDVSALEETIAPIAGVAVAGDIRDNRVLGEARGAAEAAGVLRAWVNNAGVVHLSPLHLMAPEMIDATLDIDLRAVVFGTREALSSFLTNSVSGTIVNVSSVHARGAFPGYGPYDTAKGGVEALTRYVCVEYGHLGIRCNAVAPGAVNTNIVPRTPSGAPPPVASGVNVADLSPMRRVSEPEEIAEVVAFLVEGTAQAINGHVLAVDNGISAWNCVFPPDPSVAFGPPVGSFGPPVDPLGPPL